jgi:dienelactone hydrolase
MSKDESEGCCPPGSLGAPPPPPPEFGDAANKKGTIVTIRSKNTPCYYTSPSKASSLGLILYPDVWGFQSRILQIADWLAQEGNYHVLVCDSFRGETKDDHPDMKAWFTKVPYDPIVADDTDACIEYLKTEKGVSDFGAMGFCWGAWAIGKTCKERTPTIPWKAVVSPHPSFAIEEKIFGGDAVGLMQSITCPLLLMPAGNDPAYTKPGSPEFQSLRATCSKESKSIAFEEMKHGWTTRGDMNDPAMKRDVEAALQETLKFFQMHLK